MLITTCGSCQARFRVTPQQLNARQGQVRCGRCHEVFNGFQVLERFPDDDTGGRLLAEHERKDITAPAQHAAEAPPAAPPAPPKPQLDLPLQESGAPATESADPPEPEPAHEPTAPRERRPERPRAPAPEVELTLEVEPPPPPARAWRFVAVLLVLVFAAELAYALRGPLAQRYPVLRPTMESLCLRAGCTVPFSREESLIKLENSELLEVPGRPNEIALGARVRNLATVAQEYPHIELTLTDISGQAAIRRVLRPTDYLGRPVSPGEILPAGTEIALQLRLETPRVKATGYELLLFYP